MRCICIFQERINDFNKRNILDLAMGNYLKSCLSEPRFDIFVIFIMSLGKPGL